MIYIGTLNIYHTAESETIFFSYSFTCEVYLIEVLEIMAQMRQCIIFKILKPLKMSSDFILNYLKKSCRGCYHSEISKTNTKTMISSLWTRPQGCQGGQKTGKDQRINKLMCFCANIQPKLNKLRKTS